MSATHKLFLLFVFIIASASIVSAAYTFSGSNSVQGWNLISNGTCSDSSCLITVPLWYCNESASIPAVRCAWDDVTLSDPFETNYGGIVLYQDGTRLSTSITGVEYSGINQVEHDIGSAISYWKLNGNTNDESGLYNGTYVSGNISADALPYLNMSWLGDGTDYGVYINDSNAIPTTEFTYTMWVNLPSYTTGDVIFSVGAAATSGLEIGFYGGGTAFGSRVYTTTSTEVAVISNIQYYMLPANNWIFLVVTYEQGSFMRSYINGVQVSQDTSMANSPIKLASNLTVIGGSPAGATRSWPGYIDDVRYYNQSFTLTEVRTLIDLDEYARKVTKVTDTRFDIEDNYLLASTSTVGDWYHVIKTDEDSGTTLHDRGIAVATRFGYTNADWSSDAPPYLSSSIDFELSDAADYAKFYFNAGSTAHTTCMWLNQEEHTSGPQFVFDVDAGGEDFLYVDNSTGHYTWNSTGSCSIDFGLEPTDGVWEYICLKYSNTANLTSLYKNGVLYNSSECSGAGFSASSFTFGANGAATTGWYDGKMSGIRHTPSALSDSIILGVYLTEENGTTFTVDGPYGNHHIDITSPTDNYKTNNPVPDVIFTSSNIHDENINCSLYYDGVSYGNNESVDVSESTTIITNASLSEDSYDYWVTCQNSNYDIGESLNDNYTMTIACVYSSGNWSMNASQNCNINYAEDIGGNEVLVSGMGNVTVTTNITNVSSMTVSGSVFTIQGVDFTVGNIE